MIVLILILLCYLGVNGWIFHSLFQMIVQWPLSMKVAACAIYWFLAFSFIFMELFHKYMSVTFAHIFYWISTGWLAFLLYLVLCFAATVLLKLVGISIPHIFGYSIGIIVILLIVGYIHFDRPVVKHFKIELQTKTEHKSDLRVVAVSDLHLGYGINRRRLKSYVKLINDAHPDLILIGGDLIDMSVRPLAVEKMQEELNLLKAPMGIYMVLGNHEYYAGIKESCNFIRKTHIKLLRDSIVALPNEIQIVGRDDRSNRRRKTVGQLLTSVDMNKPIFVMDHQPNNTEVKQMVKDKIDFGFFGHTHHGQLWPLSLVTDLIYAQSHGYRVWGHTHIYVSSGLGLWGPPFRIGSDSEMAVIDFSF